MNSVFNHGGRLELLEAKWTDHPGSPDTASIAQFVEIHGRENIISATIISRAPQAYPINDVVWARPVDAIGRITT